MLLVLDMKMMVETGVQACCPMLFPTFSLHVQKFVSVLLSSLLITGHFSTWMTAKAVIEKES